jgi:CCR4-NOT transcription complex subunit 1
MEVFSKYFRRLLTGNAPQIFPGVNKSVENAGNYPLLTQEMHKVATDIEQAQKIAETVDTSEGDIFRDFDLSTFLDHFRLDPIVKVALALAFKLTNKSDLRAKGSFLFTRFLFLPTNRSFFSRRHPLEFNHTLPPKLGKPIRNDQGLP